MTEIITDDYYEGIGCTCCASSANECGCEGADWTPKEVYDLRGEVMAFIALAESTANLAKALKEDLDEEKKWHHQTHAELVKAQCKNLRQAERIRYLEGATNHACGTPLSVALKERDEARGKYATEATEHMLAINKICNERDEARNAIVGWENKWKCAIDMAARAELERDEARELAQQMSESNQVLQVEVRDYRKKEKAKPFYKY